MNTVLKSMGEKPLINRVPIGSSTTKNHQDEAAFHTSTANIAYGTKALGRATVRWSCNRSAWSSGSQAKKAKNGSPPIAGHAAAQSTPLVAAQSRIRCRVGGMGAPCRRQAGAKVTGAQALPLARKEGTVNGRE